MDIDVSAAIHSYPEEAPSVASAAQHYAACSVTPPSEAEDRPPEASAAQASHAIDMNYAISLARALLNEKDAHSDPGTLRLSPSCSISQYPCLSFASIDCSQYPLYM